MLTPDEVLQILSEVCRVPLSSLKPETRLIQDLDLDSVLTLELLMTLEERMGSEVPEVEAAKLVTVGDLLELVRQQGASD
jgi:acyl carrier protein